MNIRFDILATSIVGLTLLQRKPMGDSRGYFERMFCVDELSAILKDRRIAQVNHTLTVHRGTVRGMHFQYAPYAEAKFVSCLRGEAFDVAVDLRRDSTTFLQWHAEILSASNHKTLFIPEGFAHGFQTLTDDCEMLYFHTAAYHEQSEGRVHPQDPKLAIKWPLPVVGLSAQDIGQTMIDERFLGIKI